jgi:hypothetical protein
VKWEDVYQVIDDFGEDDYGSENKRSFKARQTNLSDFL